MEDEIGKLISENQFPEWGALLGWAATLVLASYNLIKFIINKFDKKQSKSPSQVVSVASIAPTAPAAQETNGKDKELRDELREDMRRIEKRLIAVETSLRARIESVGKAVTLQDKEIAVLKALNPKPPHSELREDPAPYKSAG